MSAPAISGLRIGEVARQLGTTPRTIRYYEGIGLLEAGGGRAAGQHRLYGEREVEHLRDALRLKELLGVSLDELKALLEAGCDHVLLDNMDEATMREAVAMTAGRAVLEASGGVTLDRARTVAETGVDFISVGALTHSVTALDLGMDMK